MQTRFMLVFILAIILSATSNSSAAIYKYIDNNGIICFSDDLQSIPEQCRATAKIVSGRQEEESKTSVPKQPLVQAEESPAVGTSTADRGKVSILGHFRNSFSSRVMISLIAVMTGVFAFVILGIFDTEHKKTTRVVRVVILWVVSVYLCVAHAGDVVHLYRTFEGKVDSAQRASEEKGKKAARAMKEMNAFMQQLDNATPQDSGEPESGKN